MKHCGSDYLAAAIQNNREVPGPAKQKLQEGKFLVLLTGSVYQNKIPVDLSKLNWGKIYERTLAAVQEEIKAALCREAESALWSAVHSHLRDEYRGKMDDAQIINLTTMAVNTISSEAA